MRAEREIAVKSRVMTIEGSQSVSQSVSQSDTSRKMGNRKGEIRSHLLGFINLPRPYMGLISVNVQLDPLSARQGLLPEGSAQRSSSPPFDKRLMVPMPLNMILVFH